MGAKWFVATSAITLCLGVLQDPGAQEHQMVFVCGRDGIEQICSASSSGSDVRQLTSGNETKGSPRWSPDRRTIAFFRRPAVMRPGESMDLYAMSPSGTDVRRLTNSDGSVLYRNPTWSPDGLHLAMECASRIRPEAGPAGMVSEICVIEADGSGMRRLTSSGAEGAGSEGPDWSPDGRRIAFHSDRVAMASGSATSRARDIYVMDIDGSNVRRLTMVAPGATAQNPSWSPDGRELAFASRRIDGAPADWEVYVVSADGGARRQVTKDTKGAGHPRWSPDGRRLVFHSIPGGGPGRAEDVELYAMDASGANLQRLTNNQNYDGFADWGTSR